MTNHDYSILVSMKDGYIVENFIDRNNMSEKKDQIMTEVQQILANTEANSYSGVIYSKVTCNYFYVKKIKLKEDGLYYLLVPIIVTDAISFYFHKKSFDYYIESEFSRLIFDDNTLYQQQIESTLLLITQYSQKNISNTQDLNSSDFDDSTMNFLLNNFGTGLDIVLHSLVLKKTLIIQNVPKDSTEQFKKLFLKFIPELEITITDGINEIDIEHYSVILNTSEKKFEIDEVVTFDCVTKIYKNTISIPSPPIYSSLLHDLIEFHRDGLIPFITGVYMKILWVIQRVFGAIALSRATINFDNYLLEEELDLKDIMIHIYMSLAFQKQRLII